MLRLPSRSRLAKSARVRSPKTFSIEIKIFNSAENNPATSIHTPAIAFTF